uniref:Reverse transcriptase domain-containing protein n=1 Tax=Tanacetum cinerariifolium TaxID=118510 RepID=A0A6L2M3F9_TANCI|nr:reverse transcriptase domain-containing protein [Tanacetum cinerariifolium]
MKSRDFNKDSIDTFYNSLNQSEQDSFNSAANGNFLTKNTQEALTIIKNKSKVQTSRNKPQVSSASGSSTQDAHVTTLTKQVKALFSAMNRPVNSIQNGCETCGGPHAYYECQAAGGYTQEDVYATTDLTSQMQKVLRERPQGALLSNIEPKLRDQVNSIMTRSGLTTTEPYIPPPVPRTPRVEVEREPETLMDEVHITSPASTAHVPSPGIQPVLMDALTQIPKFIKVLKDLLKDKEKLEKLANTLMNVECYAILLNKVPEKLYGPRKFLIPCVLQDLEADPRVPIILGRPFLRTARALVDLYEEKLTLRVRNEEVMFYTDKSSRNNSRDIHSVNCINIINFSKDKMISCNPTPSSDYVVESPSSSPITYEDEKKSSGSTTTHSDYFLLDYNAFYFDDDHIKEKISDGTTTHSDFSLPGHDSFIFDLSIDPFPLVDRSALYHEEFVDELAHIISPPEYDYFYSDLEADPREFTRVLKENIFDLSTKGLTFNEFNDSSLLLSDCDSSILRNFSRLTF